MRTLAFVVALALVACDPGVAPSTVPDGSIACTHDADCPGSEVCNYAGLCETRDAGDVDAGQDAGLFPCWVTDTCGVDAGDDAGIDAGLYDAGHFDAGLSDLDAGVDAGSALDMDAGPTECVTVDGGVVCGLETSNGQTQPGSSWNSIDGVFWQPIALSSEGYVYRFGLWLQFTIQSDGPALTMGLYSDNEGKPGDLLVCPGANFLSPGYDLPAPTAIYFGVDPSCGAGTWISAGSYWLALGAISDDVDTWDVSTIQGSYVDTWGQPWPPDEHPLALPTTFLPDAGYPKESQLPFAMFVELVSP